MRVFNSNLLNIFLSLLLVLSQFTGEVHASNLKTNLKIVPSNLWQGQNQEIYLSGIKFESNEKLRFAWFIANKQNTLNQEELNENLKYFLIALTVPNNDLWVNLDVSLTDMQVLGNGLSHTDVGRIMLLSDLMLKKDVLRLGNQFGIWGKIAEYAESLGAESMLSFKPRFWIVPGDIEVVAAENGVLIKKASLKVKCVVSNEERINSLGRNIAKYAKSVIERELIPILAEKINTSPKYSSLRQVYRAVILSQYYKRNLMGTNPYFDKLIDKVATGGLQSNQDWNPRWFLDNYVHMYRLHAFSGAIWHYASGGIDISEVLFNTKSVNGTSVFSVFNKYVPHIVNINITKGRDSFSNTKNGFVVKSLMLIFVGLGVGALTWMFLSGTLKSNIYAGPLCAGIVTFILWKLKPWQILQRYLRPVDKYVSSMNGYIKNSIDRINSLKLSSLEKNYAIGMLLELFRDEEVNGLKKEYTLFIGSNIFSLSKKIQILNQVIDILFSANPRDINQGKLFLALSVFRDVNKIKTLFRQDKLETIQWIVPIIFDFGMNSNSLSPRKIAYSIGLLLGGVWECLSDKGREIYRTSMLFGLDLSQQDRKDVVTHVYNSLNKITDNILRQITDETKIIVSQHGQKYLTWINSGVEEIINKDSSLSNVEQIQAIGWFLFLASVGKRSLLPSNWRPVLSISLDYGWRMVKNWQRLIEVETLAMDVFIDKYRQYVWFEVSNILKSNKVSNKKLHDIFNLILNHPNISISEKIYMLGYAMQVAPINLNESERDLRDICLDYGKLANPSTLKLWRLEKLVARILLDKMGIKIGASFRSFINLSAMLPLVSLSNYKYINAIEFSDHDIVSSDIFLVATIALLSIGLFKFLKHIKRNRGKVYGLEAMQKQVGDPIVGVLLEELKGRISEQLQNENTLLWIKDIFLSDELNNWPFIESILSNILASNHTVEFKLWVIGEVMTRYNIVGRKALIEKLRRQIVSSIDPSDFSVEEKKAINNLKEKLYSINRSKELEVSSSEKDLGGILFCSLVS